VKKFERSLWGGSGYGGLKKTNEKSIFTILQGACIITGLWGYPEKKKTNQLFEKRLEGYHRRKKKKTVKKARTRETEKGRKHRGSDPIHSPKGLVSKKRLGRKKKKKDAYRYLPQKEGLKGIRLR